jgi:pyruvate dehydrogenase E1 component alpha subunit
MGARLRGDNIAVISYFGDGATSKGDFHEGFNLAGVYRLPVVFICQNNQWAISVPIERQTAAPTLAQKAIAYGFEGVRVDGNDVFAVYRATRDALEKARSGGGPTFIECFTYRMSDHTTADDASRYRPTEEAGAWRGRDPIKRLERYMEKKGLWSEAYGKEVASKAAGIIDDAVHTAESATPPELDDMFASTFAMLTPRLQRQREELTQSSKSVADT